MNLFEALPELVHDMEASLVRLGRGKVADQLRGASILGWRRDDFAQSTRLDLTPGPVDAAEVISLHDEIGVSLDLDGSGRVMGIDVEGYEEFLARLGEPGA